eukprot:735692-Rhodomonas_salina.2
MRVRSVYPATMDCAGTTKLGGPRLHTTRCEAAHTGQTLLIYRVVQRQSPVILQIQADLSSICVSKTSRKQQLGACGPYLRAPGIGSRSATKSFAEHPSSIPPPLSLQL